MDKQYPPPPYANPNPYGGQTSYGAPAPPPPPQAYGLPPPLPQAYGPPPPQPYPAYPQYPTTNNNNTISNNLVFGAPAPVAAAPQTTIIRHSTQDTCCVGENPNFNGEAGRTLGFIQLTCGIITIIVIGITYGLRTYFDYPGIGSSIAASIFFYIPTGVLGIFTYSKSRCVIIGYMVMCILTSVEAFGMICYESSAAALYSYDENCEWWVCDWEINPPVVALHAIAAIIALIMFITVLVGSCLCCQGSQVSSGNGTTVVYHGAQGPVDKLQTLVKAANVCVEPYWPGLSAKALSGTDIGSLSSNDGAGGGAVAPAAGGAAEAQEEEKKEEKEESEEESDDDMGFGLFD